MRASAVVNCQSTWRWSVLVACCQAASSVLRVSRSVMRRSRHWRVRADSSISAMLSQEPCLGVWWISSRWARANAVGGFERLVERADAVGVEVVHDQHDGLGVGVVVGEQALDLAGPVDPGPVGLGVDAAPAAQGFDPDEDRAGAVADVLAVLLAVMAGRGGDRVADMSRAAGRASRPCTPPAGGDRRVGRRRPGRLPSGRRTRRWRAAGWSSTSSDEDAVSFF